MTDIPIEALFYFSNEELSLLEIRIGMEFHWLVIPKDSKEVIKLEFKGMSKEVVGGNDISIRKFSEGELRFDNDFAKFIYQDKTNLIQNQPVNEVPAEITGLIIHWLNNK